MEVMCKCGHEVWDHFIDDVILEDGDESLIASECKLCSCMHFEEKLDDTKTTDSVR